MAAADRRSLGAWFRLSLSWITPERLFRANIVIDLALLCLAAIFVLSPREATFVADAVTETARIEMAPGDLAPRWGALPVQPLPSLPGEAANPALANCAAPVLDLGDRLDRPISLVATSTGDGVEIFLSTADKRGLGSLACSDGEEVPAPDQMLARWSGGAADGLTLGIHGKVTIGAVPPAGSAHAKILRSGTLRVESSAFPFKTGRAISSVPLDIGDELKLFADAGDEKEASATGLIRWDDGALHILARAKGESARINSIGLQNSNAVAVAPTLLDKIKAQSEWAVVLFCVAVLLNMFAAAHAHWALRKDS